MFSFKLIIANCLLILIAGVLLLKNIEIWQKDLPDLPHNELEKVADLKAGKVFSQKRVLPPSLYSVITNKNLFSPERQFNKAEEVQITPVLPLDEPIESVAKVLGKEIFVHGITIVGEYKTALISNYYYLVRKERPLKLVKVGGMIEDFEVIEIEPKHVMLERKGRRYKLKLYDAKKESTKSSVAAPTSVARKGEKGVPTVISATPKTAPTRKAEEPDLRTETEEYEIIETPFGPVKRKK